MIDADVVMIHGFWSSSSTWGRIVKRLEVDEEVQGLRVHLFGYESPKLRLPGSPARIPDYDDIAQSLPSFLAVRTRSGSPIIFVTHSQGGLILQRFLAWMLSEGRGRELVRVRSVVLLACPNEGSEYLASIRAVTGFNRHPQASQLAVLERDVGEARRIVLRQIVNAPSLDDRQCQIPFYVYSGRTDNIVLRQSAQTVFPHAEVIPGDHFSILDPDSPGSLTIDTIKRHILGAVSAAPVLSATSAAALPMPATAAGLAQEDGTISTVVSEEKRTLNVRIDDCRRLVRRDAGRMVTFGAIRADIDGPVFAEGVHLRVTVENAAFVAAFVTRVDLVVVAHDPGFVASYPQISLPGLHHEVPQSDLPPVHLDELADLDGRVGVSGRQLMLEPGGQPGAHHSMSLTVLAVTPGLWRLSVAARYFFTDASALETESITEVFTIVKR